MEKRQPTVDVAAEFFEIVMDFRDPRDAIREAISNAFDAKAKTIWVTAEVTPCKGLDELVLTLEDDGVGMEVEAKPGEGVPNLHAFFDLGNSSGRGRTEFIGEKGHGTKTYFNSREIEVFSWRGGKELHALMCDPRATLAERRLPEYDWEVKQSEQAGKTGTRIVVRGYNRNVTKGFGHDELRDFICWFTKFGSMEVHLGVTQNRDKRLVLRGLGAQEAEELSFGHPFPPKERYEIKELRRLDPSSPTKYFVKKWCERGLPVKRFPHFTLDMVFWVEGDRAKDYNKMIRRRGKTPHEGMYAVEERYGLWACKDFVPVQRVTEWVSQGQRAASTKFHAFVNCQHFKLTANRGDIGNTDEQLMNSIRETVVEWFDQKILADPTYKKYEEELALEVEYRKPEEEEKEHSKRKKLAANKKVFVRSNKSLLTERSLELFEPRQEIEVYGLFCTLYALNPDLFGFKVVDYDAHRGYDALVETKTGPGLDRETLRFVELKRTLERDFNHSFGKLAAVVSWDCSLGSGEQLKDIKGEVRTLKITKASSSGSYTKYMLTSDTDPRNIEVFVLKDYLKEKCKIDFRPRG